MKIAGKKILGVGLVLVGVVAFFTPLTPGSWLALVGLELLGIRLLTWDKIRNGLRKKRGRRDFL